MYLNLTLQELITNRAGLTLTWDVFKSFEIGKIPVVSFD